MLLTRTALSKAAKLILLATVTLIVGSQAFATIPTYTGCYSASSGTINKLAVGFSPQKPCNTGDVQVSFSAGDITKLSVSGGLTGGGDNGDITISLDPKYSLPQSCAANQVAKWTGSAWQCANDENTTYTAGTGLNLSPGQFSVGSAYQLPQSCSDGSVAKNNGGAWQCGTDNVGNTEVWNTFIHESNGWSGGALAYIASLTLPAGTYIAMMSAAASSDISEAGLDLNVYCGLYENKTGSPFTYTGVMVEGVSGLDTIGPLAMTALVTLTAQTTLDLGCAADAKQHLQNVSLMALKVGVVH